MDYWPADSRVIHATSENRKKARVEDAIPTVDQGSLGAATLVQKGSTRFHWIFAANNDDGTLVYDPIQLCLLNTHLVPPGPKLVCGEPVQVLPPLQLPPSKEPHHSSKLRAEHGVLLPFFPCRIFRLLHFDRLIFCELVFRISIFLRR
jgi:hypothetical protein